MIKVVTESSGTKTVSKARYCVADYEKISNSKNDGFVEDVTLRSYTYCKLEKATKGFSDQVGKRPFGTFYKRVIPSNGGRVVAIKKLEKVMDQGDWEFRNEMNAIGRTHHKNLVKLLGYYHDGSNRLLVYEYMTNGFKLFNSVSMFMDEEAMDESTHNLLLSAKLNALQVIALGLCYWRHMLQKMCEYGHT
ncbi:hypothetical protein FF1_034060 [Malus domestica]